MIFSGCHEHNISEYKKALSWAQRNGYKSDIENLKREIAEEQAKLNEENSMTLIGKFIKKYYIKMVTPMYKNVQHYRHTVHRYLDAIWKVSNKNRDARSTMYSWLSI